ncbi:Uncharacterised protein [Mycobacteroides abscessus subsp. abscessus]|uniref:hypothetical protein n=1 Tax=Mycobacteroides abscessus TaxID=36809 RepID=UPI00092C4CCF|nr:hypothetical protein [Mycobacteroides abscessus]MDM2350221.1 hypothetical protein [Mycobacteroides abscessus]MDM2356824.1 hypothetical protein [Mycobacteroides abscessus]QSN53978.1 hypothetical protein I3U39_10025 [Mycobacteroides abscessus subsp. abscessus]SHU59307.1 Uncharacterised protein [Mycobacteroides abscessus subsp. abscessus]SIH26571.1 Uncharacterised protein [Mycobacteroides abscessus subsp. abscessus]
MAAPTGDDLLAFLADATKADQIVGTVTQLAKGYTRGKGFDASGVPADDLRAIILTASARLYANPKGLLADTMGPFQVQFGPDHFSWTVAELFVLNRYRERAQ